MKEKIQALLEAKFQGVRKDGLNHLAGALALQVNTEEEAASAVDGLSAEQVNRFVTDWRREVDAEITKANKTHEDGLRKKYDFAEKKPDKPEESPPAKLPEGTLDAEAIQRIVIDTVHATAGDIMKKVTALEGSIAGRRWREVLEKELADVPEVYRGKVLKDFDRMTFPDEDSFNGYLNDTRKDVEAFTQELSDLKLSGIGRPIFGTSGTDGVSAGVQNYIKEKTGSEKVLTGKEI
ncbi:MAG: hypothetical protein LBP50_09500 [Tannerella sp.]|jgi:hypothetical protein|nr:hypothetical protein [Tannerella sp.]